MTANERALAFLRELEQADAEVAVALRELDELAERATRLRKRALELEAFLASLPATRERLERQLAEAECEVEERRELLTRAEEELLAAERGKDAQRIAAARRAEVRARDAKRSAERKLEALDAEARRLDLDAEAAAREGATLESEARELARALAARPPLTEQAGAEPPPGLPGAAEWASRARGALLVARGRLSAERDAVIRQANELGSVVLGEPLAATSAALVARRVERAARE